MSKRQLIGIFMLIFGLMLLSGCGLFSKQYALTTTSNGEGTVSISPKSSQYHSGTEVKLTAKPEPHWKFDHWSGDTSGSEPTITVVMDQNQNIMAHFLPIQFAVNTTVEGNGRVEQTLLVSPQEVYNSGQPVQIRAVADDGWEFIEWQGDLTGNMNPQTIMVDKEYSVEAVFSKKAASKWNFLVYLDGDNNLEMCAISDINEMEEVGSTQDVNILVLIDRNPSYDSSNGDWSGTRLYRITKDENRSGDIVSELVVDYGELDMSDPQVLENFLLTCQEKYPSERTILTLWDHGDGVYPKSIDEDDKTSDRTPPPIRVDGICWDDTTGTDPWSCLTTDEIASALANVRQVTGKKIDLINMDACLMQMLEVAYEWRQEIDYLVGSQADVPGEGNNYDALLEVLTTNPDITTLEFAQTLVDEYYTHYKIYGGGMETYSALRFGTEFDHLMSAFQSFATAMYQTTDLDGVFQAWENATFFSARQYIDLYDFAGELKAFSQDSDVVNAATTLQLTIEDLVVNHTETTEYQGKAFGLSIFLASNREWPEYAESNQYVSFLLSQDTDWDEFILRFVEYTAALTSDTLLKFEMTWPNGDCDLGIWEPDNAKYWNDQGTSSPNGVFSENMIDGGTETWTINTCHVAGFYSPLVYSRDYTGSVDFTLTFQGETITLAVDVEPGVEYIVYDFEIVEDEQGIPEVTYEMRQRVLSDPNTE